MYSEEVLELVCDVTFRTLVREGQSLQAYITKNNKKIVQEAIELIQSLDAQQIVCTVDSIEKSYNGVLHKIFFSS